MHRHRLWAKAKRIDKVYLLITVLVESRSKRHAHDEMKRVTVFTDVTGDRDEQPFDSPAHANQANAVRRSMDKGWTRGISLIMNVLSNGRGCLEVPRDSDSPSVR